MTRGGPPWREIFERARIYSRRKCPPFPSLVAWINSVSLSKCFSKSLPAPGGLLIPPRVERNRILASRSSVITFSKLTTRTRFTQSGNYCFEIMWKLLQMKEKCKNAEKECFPSCSMFRYFMLKLLFNILLSNTKKSLTTRILIKYYRRYIPTIIKERWQKYLLFHK